MRLLCGNNCPVAPPDGLPQTAGNLTPDDFFQQLGNQLGTLNEVSALHIVAKNERPADQQTVALG